MSLRIRNGEIVEDDGYVVRFTPVCPACGHVIDTIYCATCDMTCNETDFGTHCPRCREMFDVVLRRS